MAAVQQPPLSVPDVKVPYTKIGQHAPVREPLHNADLTAVWETLIAVKGAKSILFFGGARAFV